MNFAIMPLIGVGELKFGMSPGEVRTLAGAAFTSFKRSPMAEHPCDYFESLGTFCYYDKAGALEAVEMATPSTPSLNGKFLLERAFDYNKQVLAQEGGDVESEADGALAVNIGVSIYAPLAKNNAKAPVESVIAFREGYYD